MHDISKPYTFSQNGKLVPPLPKPAPSLNQKKQVTKCRKQRKIIQVTIAMNLQLLQYLGE
jgi:hypothetical protein